MSARVWLVNPYDDLPWEGYRRGRYEWLAQTLASLGAEVTWWTSNFSHFDKRCRKPQPEELNLPYRLVQIPTRPYRNNVGLARVLNQRGYARGLLKTTLHGDETRPDIILASLPPIESAYVVCKLAKAYGSQLVIDVQDLWPDAFYLLLPRPLKPLIKLVSLPFRMQVRTALTCAELVLGNSKMCTDWAEKIAGQSLNMMVVPLAPDLACLRSLPPPDPSKRRPPDERWITYCGALGLSFDFDVILEAAKQLVNQVAGIRFLVIGEGPKKRMIDRSLKGLPDGLIQFTGGLSYEVAMGMVAQSEVALNTLVPGAPQAVSKKLFDYIGLGVPIVNSAEGEAWKFVNDHKIGLNYAAGNPQSLSESIATLLEDRDFWLKCKENLLNLAPNYNADDIYRDASKAILSLV